MHCLIFLTITTIPFESDQINSVVLLINNVLGLREEKEITMVLAEAKEGIVDTVAYDHVVAVVDVPKSRKKMSSHHQVKPFSRANLSVFQLN